MVLLYEDAISLVGEFGKYQRIVLYVGSLLLMGCCMSNLSIVFLAAVPNHWCRVPALESLNLTLEQTMELSLPTTTKDGIVRNSHCQVYDLPYDNLTTESALELLQLNVSTTKRGCQAGWTYDTSEYKSSIVTEWSLVCDDRALAALSQSVYMAGLMVGVFSMGLLSDAFGRRVPTCVCAVGNVITAIASVFSVNFYMFLAMRFLIAFCQQAVLTIFFVIIIELVGPKQRVLVTIIGIYYWIAGYMFIVLFAYFIREWRYLQLAIALSLLIYLPICFVIPESPRWLYSKGRREQGDIRMRTIATVNGRTVPDNLDVAVKMEERVYIWSILQFPRLRLRAFVMCYLWLVNSMVYYGLSFGSSSLGGNDYVNFLILGGIEIPANILCHVTLDRLGRRPTTSGTMLVGGLMLLLTMAVPQGTRFHWLLITMTTIGKLCISASFTVVYVYVVELFPTLLRSSVLGTASLFARIGGVVVPQLWLLTETSKYIPLAILGALSLVGGLMTLALPETMGAKLPDTLEGSNAFGSEDFKPIVDDPKPEQAGPEYDNPAFENDATKL